MRLFTISALVWLWTAVLATAQSAAVFSPDDMLAVQTFAGGQPVAVSSTGRLVAYVLTDGDDEWNIQEPRPTGHLVVQSLGEGPPGPPRALTSGPVHGAFPVWSPDGGRLAFVRREGDSERVVVWDAASGETATVGPSLEARTYLAPQWAPSGDSLIVAAAQPDAPDVPYRVRVVKSSDARVPGDDFFTDERRAMLTALDVSTGRAVPLLPEPVVLRSFAVSPTGRQVLYVAPIPALLGVIGRERNETFVTAIDAASATPAVPRKLNGGERFSWSQDGTHLLFQRQGRLMALPADGSGAAEPWRPAVDLNLSRVSWAPDGSQFAALVQDPSVVDPEIEPVDAGMYTVARPFMDLYLVSADGRAENLTAGFSDQVADPVWSPDGAAVYFRTIDNETYDEHVYRYTLADRTLQPLLSGKESYGPPLPLSNGVVVRIEDATHPEDLWMVGIDGERTRLTTLNPQLARFTFAAPELFYYVNADGDRMGALLYRPPGVPATQPVPVITWVYEKMTPAIHRFNARDQMFISHGYAMLMPNVKVHVGETADSFAKCVVPAVNAVRAMGFTNGRFGLWGHSFGAYATSTLITRTNVFAAAVSGATPPELFRNWASGRDRDARNIETGQARMGGTPFEYRERYLSQSAFFQLDRVETPVLILHGEKDLTILFGEGEMMFYALRRLGKTAEFVAYANGDHSLSRHSRADALDVNRRILEWFDRYLKGHGAH